LAGDAKGELHFTYLKKLKSTGKSACATEGKSKNAGRRPAVRKAKNEGDG
jgi:hypothetical protein